MRASCQCNLQRALLALADAAPAGREADQSLLHLTLAVMAVRAGLHQPANQHLSPTDRQR